MSDETMRDRLPVKTFAGVYVYTAEDMLAFAESEVKRAQDQHPDVAAIQAEAKREERRELARELGLVLDAWGTQHADKIVNELFGRDACQPTPSKTCSACGGTKIVEFRTNVGTRYNVDCNACVTQPTPSKQEAPAPVGTSDSVLAMDVIRRAAEAERASK